MVKISNYEKIRRMSVDALTDFLYFLNDDCKECCVKYGKGKCSNKCREGIKMYLLNEGD